MAACAPPRVEDVTLALQRLYRPRRHPCEVEPEVRLLRQNWSNSLDRRRPSSQTSYPHTSLDLLQRRPPCTCKSSCQFLRLPPWEDVAAELHAQGLLNADLCFSPWGILVLDHSSLSCASDITQRNSPIVVLKNKPDVSWGLGPLPSGITLLFFRGISG